MSTPIDELLISVEIDEGSKLEELYVMLKELQSSGGKIEVEIPQEQFEEIGTKINNLGEKINKITDVLKPLIEKFPNMIDKVKELSEEVLTNLKEFVIVYNENEEARGDIVKKIVLIINNIEEIKDKIGKITIEGKLESTEKFDMFFQTLIDLVNQVLEKVIRIDNRIGPLRAHITNKTKQIIENLSEEIKKIKEGTSSNDITDILNVLNEINGDIISLYNQIQENKKDIFENLNKQQEDLLQFMSQVQEISFVLDETKTMIDWIREKIASMNEEILDLPTKTEIEQNFKNFSEKILNRLDDISKNIFSLASVKDLEGTEKRFEEMRSQVLEQFNTFLGDYFSTTDELRRFRIKLEKIPQDRTETRRLIEEKINKALVDFKGKLDDNLTKVINEVMLSELNEFGEAIQAVLKKQEEIKLPGILPLEERKSLEDISGFWRYLISNLVKTSVENMQENIDAYLQMGFLRRIQEMHPLQIKDVGRTLGIQLSKSEQPKIIFQKVLEAVKPYNVAELITGMFPEKRIEQFTTQLNVDEIIKNTEEVYKLKRSVEKVSVQIDDQYKKIKQDFFDPSKKILEDINAKLDEKPPMEKANENDKNKKGTL